MLLIHHPDYLPSLPPKQPHQEYRDPHALPEHAFASRYTKAQNKSSYEVEPLEEI